MTSNMLSTTEYNPPSSSADAPTTTTASEAPRFAAPAAAMPNAYPSNFVDLTSQEDVEAQAVSSTSSEPTITSISHPKPHTPRIDLLRPKSASWPSTGTLSRMEGGPPRPRELTCSPSAPLPQRLRSLKDR